MKVDLKGILKSLPPGSQDLFFYKLNEISREMKEGKKTDPKAWVLAYNLMYFAENQPIRRYVAYEENPQNYKLDQGLLPYVKVVRAYARMSDTQKESFRTEVKTLSSNIRIVPPQYLNSKQNG